jgi:hypothetical protein
MRITTTYRKVGAFYIAYLALLATTDKSGSYAGNSDPYTITSRDAAFSGPILDRS